ncbi:MAG: hypothetical protein KDD60_06285 [Bdellovibrionales bacterium]|nr:hypothetical protein [Bdellovibrionales bacterium]
MKITRSTKHPNQSELGASLTEYGIAVSLISVVALMAVTSLGQGTGKALCQTTIVRKGDYDGNRVLNLFDLPGFQGYDTDPKRGGYGVMDFDCNGLVDANDMAAFGAKLGTVE